MNKINNAIKKAGKYFNIANILTGLFIGLAHVYIPFPSIIGLVFGILITLSGSAVMGINYYFTSTNAIPNEAPKKSPFKKSFLSVQAKARLFLILATPCIFLNAIASFIGMYTGIMLLAAALALPFAPPVVITIAVVASSLFVIGTLLNSWLQTYNIWEGIKKSEEPTKPVTTDLDQTKELIQTMKSQCNDVATQTEDFDNEPSHKEETPPSPPPFHLHQNESPSQALLFYDSSSHQPVIVNEKPALTKQHFPPTPAWSSLK